MYHKFLPKKLQFVHVQDPILDLPAAPLKIEFLQDQKLQNFFDLLFQFAKGEQSDQKKHVLVGLAAPQVGVNIRVILVDVKADGKGHTSELRFYINPEIIEFSKEKEEWYEACFSAGNVKGIVKRASQIKIKAWDRKGNEIKETHSGYVARIFQHEIDHLNGIRFPDRIDKDELLHLVKEEEMGSYRNEEKWRNWEKTISQNDWKKFMN